MMVSVDGSRGPGRGADPADCAREADGDPLWRGLAGFAAVPVRETRVRRELAARLLASPGARERLAGGARGADRRAAVLDVARLDVAEAGERDWTRRAESWLTAVRATWWESAAFCADVAWTARREGYGPAWRLTVADVLAPRLPPPAARARLHLYALGLRYDFRCDALRSLFAAHPVPVAALDPYSRALHAFAVLGESDPAGLGALEAVPAAAGDDVKTLHALLHGLWLGVDLPDGPLRTLALVGHPAFAVREDPIAGYREACALRRLRRYRAATAAIERALDGLPPGTEESVRRDLLRERLVITAMAGAGRDRSGGR
ncbi:protein of unknown function (plasmid) [Streptantibioticus cattleyicolor NRRL 8057 = DSM 46488]|nr:protein of unknown function [Streptantibioticus cattleyicolor NRRL 8057 = DSM 46488]